MSWLSVTYHYFPRLALLALVVPVASFSAIIDANGTCVFPSPAACAAGPDTLTPGTNIAQTFNFNVTVNGALFNVSGTTFNNFPSTTFLGFFPTVTYLGATPLTGTDTITLDMLQNFTDPQLVNPNWSGSYSENIPLILGPNSSASGQALYDGQTVGQLGPVTGSGVYNLSQVSTLNNLDGNPLQTDYKLSFTFGPGTLPGQASSSPTPEPAETLLLCVSGLGLVLFKSRKLSRR